MTAGEFDIIVAADVLHLAPDVCTALNHVKNLLAQDGLLVLIEPHEQHAFDLVFGQSTGWPRCSDTDLRPQSALLAPEQWEIALARVGFTEIKRLSDKPALAGMRDITTIGDTGAQSHERRFASCHFNRSTIALGSC
jgi:hypothetical protein